MAEPAQCGSKREALAQQAGLRFEVELCLVEGQRHRLRNGRARPQCAQQQESFPINSAVVDRIVKAMNCQPDSLLSHRGQLRASLRFAPARRATYDLRL